MLLKVEGQKSGPVETRMPNSEHRESAGFTLIELIVATAISALVIGIVSVCFSFALRVWQMTTKSKPDQTFRLAELLQRQLAEADPTPINFEQGARPLFAGDANSICFITSHSVKAISRGVPVAVRYTWDAGSQVLSYSELVLNPYRPAELEKFAAARNGAGEKSDVRSYKVDIPKFTLSFAGKDAKEFSPSWDSTEELPLEILLNWEGPDRTVHSMACMVNSPFAIQGSLLNPSTPGGLNP